jgi:hypothetical protein
MLKQFCRRRRNTPVGSVRNGPPRAEMLPNFIDDPRDPVGLPCRVTAGTEIQRWLTATAPLSLLTRLRYGRDVPALPAPFQRGKIQRSTVLSQGMVAGWYDIRRIQDGLFIKGLSHSLPDSRDFSLRYESQILPATRTRHESVLAGRKGRQHSGPMAALVGHHTLVEVACHRFSTGFRESRGSSLFEINPAEAPDRRVSSID